QIERLNAKILAYSAQNSNFQTRLLQTLDILDETQRNHATELKDMEHNYSRLNQRLQRHKASFVTLETERDDLKESVLALVEKVEQSNDLRSWPFNRLQLTRFTGTSFSSAPNSIRRDLENEDQLAYAGAILERLRQERDDERVAHIITRESLQSKIDTLEAQLARREAQLEHWATH
ncbi:hypothetical protein P691DRAFT_620740, partial [Macrolepiota fuliginosa MF-IS2]